MEQGDFKKTEEPGDGSKDNSDNKQEIEQPTPTYRRIEAVEALDRVFGPSFAAFLERIESSKINIIAVAPQIHPYVLLNIGLEEALMGMEVFLNLGNFDEYLASAKIILGRISPIYMTPLPPQVQDMAIARLHVATPEKSNIIDPMAVLLGGETGIQKFSFLVSMPSTFGSTNVKEFISSFYGRAGVMAENIRLFITYSGDLNSEEAAALAFDTQATVMVWMNESRKCICSMFDPVSAKAGLHDRFDTILDQDNKLNAIYSRRLRFQDNEPFEAEYVNALPSDFPEEERAMPPPLRCVEPRHLPSSAFVPVLRAVFDSPPFQNRDYECIYKILDLHQLAEYKDAIRLSFKRKLPVKLRRGELYTSYRFLAERWNCSTNKVATFLKKTQTYGLLETRNETDGTVITLCGYATKSNGDPADETQDETDFETQTETDSKRT